MYDRRSTLEGNLARTLRMWWTSIIIHEFLALRAWWTVLPYLMFAVLWAWIQIGDICDTALFCGLCRMITVKCKMVRQYCTLFSEFYIRFVRIATRKNNISNAYSRAHHVLSWKAITKVTTILIFMICFQRCAWAMPVVLWMQLHTNKAQSCFFFREL